MIAYYIGSVHPRVKQPLFKFHIYTVCVRERVRVEREFTQQLNLQVLSQVSGENDNVQILLHT